jgi:hypothetical protein
MTANPTVRTAIARLAGAPSAVQIAANGVWERAWRLPVGERAASPAEVAEWIVRNDDAGAPADIAIEVFFADVRPDAEWFIGLRLRPDQQSLAAYLITSTVGATSAVRGVGAQAPIADRVLAAWDALIREPRGTLFSSVPDHADIGVVNAWRSVGTCRVWTRGAPLPDPPAIEDVLRGAPELNRPRPLPLALELAFTRPLEHWVGRQVSSRDERGHRLDTRAAADELRLLLGGPASGA